MTKEELLNRLADIEWEDFEVKEAKSEIPRNTWETVSAFSNTAGGWLIFGVKQSGKKFEITGLHNPEKTEQDFTTTLRGEKFNIKIIPKSEHFNFDEKTILAFYIPISDKKPVYFNSLSNTFIRTASGDQRATKEEIDAMFRDQAFGTKSQKIVKGTTVNNLNQVSIERYRDYMSRFNPGLPYNNLALNEFLTKLRVVDNGELTYSGLLFFGKEDAIQRVFADFRIDLLEVPGTSYTDARQRYTYRLAEQENIWEYFFALFNRLRQSISLPFRLTTEGFASEEYPYLDALREALVNLLMHTDYFSPAKPRIRIFDDHIEFMNPGAPPKTIAELLRTDQSIPRNPVIAKLFRAVKLAETAGYGFDKMINGWRPYAHSEPQFEATIDLTIAKFYFPIKSGKKS